MARTAPALKKSAPKKGKGGPDDVDRHVGQRAKLRRLVLGMSQEALARELNLTFQQIQKYEKGANRISAGRLFQIADVLKVSVQFFFDDMDPMIGVAGFAEGAENQEQEAFMSFVSSAEGVQLNRHFSTITDPNVRKRVLELVRSIAEGASEGA